MQMRRVLLALMMMVVFVVAPAPVTQHAASNSFTIEQIKGYPFPNELTASATGARIAWAFNERGARNVWVAEGPEFKARRLTNYENDDGQELTSLSISSDGKYVVYVRGGDHGSNWESSVGVNPALSAMQTKVQIWTVPFGGGEPKLLADGDEPVMSPKGDRIAYTGRVGNRFAIFTIGVDGGEPRKITSEAADSEDPTWSPDGRYIAFVRDHDLYVMRSNGRGLRRLIDVPEEDPNDPTRQWTELSSPSWQPLR